GVVPAPLLAAGGGIDRLAVHAGGGPRGVGLLLGADLRAEGVVDGVEGAVVTPLVEVAPGGAFGREVLGQVAPLAPGAQHVEAGIDHVPEIGLAGPSSGVDRDQVPDQSPLLIGHVAGILICSRPNSLWKHPLMGQSLTRTRLSSGRDASRVSPLS